MLQRVAKLWGSEEWLVNNELYCAKFLNLNPGFVCSLHYHTIKDETFYILEGVVLLEIGDKTFCLEEGMSKRIPPSTPHRFSTVRTPAIILEVSTTHDDADVIRIEESKCFSIDTSTTS